MAKPKKSDIKKMIAELHADPKGAPGEKTHAQNQSSNVKGFSGAKKSGVYRPKI